MRPLFACLLVVLAVGCGRKSEPVPAATGSVVETPATNSNGVAAGSIGSPAPTDLTAVLAELTQALRKYSFEHQRLPRSFDELTTAGYVKDLPAPPTGKRYEIDPKNVRVVVN